MKTSLLDSQLDRIELQFHELGSLLLSGNAQQVQLASAQMQQLTVDLLHMVDEVGCSTVQSRSYLGRLRACAAAIQPLREGVLRQSAYVDRALEVVMPAAQRATYASGAKYGGAVRQSGAFKVLSA